MRMFTIVLWTNSRWDCVVGITQSEIIQLCHEWCGLLFSPLGNFSTYNYKTCKMTQVWSPLCYIQWEANPANTFTYNDGANYPNLSEGVGPMHSSKTGCNVLAIAAMCHDENQRLPGLEMPASLLKGPPTLFHWNPLVAAGTGLVKRFRKENKLLSFLM